MSGWTKSQTVFLQILESFMRNKNYQCPEDFEDVEALSMLARQHQMTAAVYEQIRMNQLFSREEYKNLFQVWKRETLRDVMTQMQRTEGFFGIVRKTLRSRSKTFGDERTNL